MEPGRLLLGPDRRASLGASVLWSYLALTMSVGRSGIEHQSAYP